MVLTWNELWFNSTNKSNQESNIRHAIDHFCLTQMWKKSCFCLCVDCSEPSVMKTDVLKFTLGCLTCLQEREYFFLYHDVIPLLVLFVFFLSSQPLWTLVVCSIRPAQDMMLLCLFTVFHACMCTYISSLKFIEVHENHKFFFSLEHPHLRLYERFSLLFWESGRKTRRRNRDNGCFFCAFWHRRKYIFSVDNLSYA